MNYSDILAPLFKRWITVSTVSVTIHWITQLVYLTLILWIWWFIRLIALLWYHVVRIFYSIQSPYCLTCICISVCPSIFFFSRLPYYVHSLFQEKGSLQFPPVFFFLFACLVLLFFCWFVCLFVVFFFMFALSQFTGPDYLVAWNRLVHKMFVAIGITLCFISG